MICYSITMVDSNSSNLTYTERNKVDPPSYFELLLFPLNRASIFVRIIFEKGSGLKTLRGAHLSEIYGNTPSRETAAP